MPKKGITREIVIQAAAQLIEQEGLTAFSMRALAKGLNIRPASLYNHVKNMDEVIAGVGAYAIEQLNRQQYQAMEGKGREEALWALAQAYREYAKAHPELYKVIMNLHRTDKQEIEQVARPITQPFMDVLSQYPLSEEQKMHWQRVLRSVIHGFLAQEEAGYFCHFPIQEEESYRLAIQCFVDGLRAATKEESR